MQVTFIIGESNSGKSSLTRCLTGKGNDRNAHPNAANVKVLAWGTSNNYVSEPTLVLHSSLNEGERGSNACISPQDLPSILDDYARIFGVTRAILCVSLTVRALSWTVDDYFTTMLNQSHSITNVLQLSPWTPRKTLPVAPISLFNANNTRPPINQIAVQARQHIRLI